VGRRFARPGDPAGSAPPGTRSTPAETGARAADAVRRPGVSGFICIEPAGYAADDALASWVQRGLDFVSGLPAKPVRASN
jgi:hypothetical protein